jgi:hypothetical protein
VIGLRRHFRFFRAALCVLAVGFVVAACGEAEVRTSPVTVAGTISAPEGVDADGTVYVSLYHAWALEGELRHPVEHIESFEAAVGQFSVEFAYPTDKGEGLLVYAWLDNDGDGVSCTPTDRDDLAGLVEVSPFPAETVNVRLMLEAPCAGPDWFYPPAT